MKTLRWLLVLVLAGAAFGLLAAAGAVRAQDGTPVPAAGAISDDEVNAVAKKLYCPVCENVPLDVCPTQACRQWRALIREQLAGGADEQSILDYFVLQYGERVLAEPSTRGINVLVWVIPPIAVALGAFFLWRVLRGMSRPAAADTPAAPLPAAQDEYVARLERELEKRR